MFYDLREADFAEAMAAGFAMRIIHAQTLDNTKVFIIMELVRSDSISSSCVQL
jgi:hypothetical protein